MSQSRLRHVLRTSAIAAIILGCNASSVTAPDPDDRLISYAAVSGSDIGIFVMHADGSQPVKLVDGENSEPTWSADGQQLAFSSHRGAQFGIWATNADGSNQHFLVEGYHPRWSPDGQSLAFTSMGPIYAVFIANADGTSPRRLTTNSLGEVRQDWSPDSKKLVFMGYVGAGFEVVAINADGTGQHQLTHHTNGFGDDPAWSPDGTEVAFSYSVDYETTQIHVIKADGTGERTLTEGSCAYPSWSPDSKKIAYACHDKSVSQIFVMNRDGSHQYPITSHSDVAISPAWKPR